MLPMLLTSADSAPHGEEWIYETKYDGFRCILIWEKNESPTLISRNEKELTKFFPEIIHACEELFKQVSAFLPFTLDGEIVHLTNGYKSNFSIVQTRGRMRNEQVISKASDNFPCQFIAFDLLRMKGKETTHSPLSERKKLLEEIFPNMALSHKEPVQKIQFFNNEEEIWKKVKLNQGEGVVAKRTTSTWNSGERSKQWIKVKNWRYVTVLLTKYDQTNGYFHGYIYDNEELVEVTTFRHGLSDEEMQTLITFFQTNGHKPSPSIWELTPSICAEVACIDFDGKKLREPRFSKFRFEIDPTDANMRNMQRQLHPLPSSAQITHPEKPVWPEINIVKDDYLMYLQKIAPSLLPFLNNRLLTAIRFPHGVPGESFYQKNAPDYTPPFVKTQNVEDINYILCNDIETLVWLGNQLAIEFHIPFQTIDTQYPTEIVFDLDPPSVNEFSLAIKAAIRMKAIFDSFHLQSFVKTSGGKGLQIYIPLPKNTFSYEDTRIFTKFVCSFLCEQEPGWFTMERLKKNRHNKLYLDFVQHAEGKTIIAPYSPRGNEHGLIATPLFWEEVIDTLTPKSFTIPTVLERIKTKGDPFRNFFYIGEEQEFGKVLSTLKELTKA